MITCIIIGKVHIFEKQSRPHIQTKPAPWLCFMVSWVLIGRKDTFQLEYWRLPKGQSVQLLETAWDSLQIIREIKLQFVFVVRE